MSSLVINKDTIENIALAIKDGLGDEDKMYPREMSSKIRQIGESESITNTTIFNIWQRVIGKG